LYIILYTTYIYVGAIEPFEVFLYMVQPTYTTSSRFGRTVFVAAIIITLQTLPIYLYRLLYMHNMVCLRPLWCLLWICTHYRYSEISIRISADVGIVSVTILRNRYNILFSRRTFGRHYNIICHKVGTREHRCNNIIMILWRIVRHYYIGT